VITPKTVLQSSTLPAAVPCSQRRITFGLRLLFVVAMVALPSAVVLYLQTSQGALSLHVSVVRELQRDSHAFSIFLGRSGSRIGGVNEHCFRAMNTDIRLAVLDDDQALLERAAAVFTSYERTLSRFDPASELSALNRAGERPTVVSPLLCAALAAADQLRRATGGLYNPAVLPALEAAGYDRSFELLAERAAPGPSSDTALLPPPQPYRLDAPRRLVQLAPGVRLDLGGIGKGLAVDAAADLLRGQPGFLVDAGGDVRLGGQSPNGGLWCVGVQDPLDLERDLAVLVVSDCAVATSSVGRRRWSAGGGVRHHLIDPRTGRSAESDALAATVVGPSCATAEVWAKALVIAGVREGLALAAREGLAALLVDTERGLHASEPMRPLIASLNA